MSLANPASGAGICVRRSPFMRNYLQRRWSIDSKPGSGRACRNFTLIDAMILVGAVAVGFAGCRAGSERFGESSYRVLFFVTFFLMLASWLVLIFRGRGPRPPIRLLARQPGAVACFAVVVLQVVQFVDSLFVSHIFRDLGYLSGIGLGIWSFLADFHHTSAAVVPICWAVLVATRRWRAEPGWIDRSGRIVGWAWIAWIFAWPLLYWYTNRLAMNGPF